MHCRLEYIQVGTPSESLWAQFLDSLSEISEARAYIMLYESPVDGLDLSLEETVALHSSSLLVIPPRPPGHSPLSGHRGQILAEASLPKWASLVQEVASGMRQLPLEAQACPPNYYDSLLSRLSTLARIPYCRQCYELGPVCTCPKGQPANSRWTRPVQPYTGTMSTAPVSMTAGSIPTWASISAAGRPSAVLPPPGYPPLPVTPFMDVSSHWTSIRDTGVNLLKTAGVGRGLRLQSVPPQQAPPVPGVTGIQQVRPVSVGPPASTSAGGGEVPKTPYQQQIQVPSSNRIVRYQAPKAKPNEGSLQVEIPGKSRDGDKAKSTRYIDPSLAEDPMSCVMVFRSRGWSRDLEHIVSCYYLAQVGPLDKVWLTCWMQFTEHMHTAKDEWVDIKELTPLQFMPYVQKWFQTTTGIHLKDLDRLVEWIHASGYYHWKVANLGQLHLCPHLSGKKVPRGPIMPPSIRKRRLAKRAAKKARKAVEAASRPGQGKPATQGTQQRSNAGKSQQGSSTDKTQQSSSSREAHPSSSTGQTLPSSASKKTEQSSVEAMDIGGSGDSCPWEARVQEADQSAKRRCGNSGEAIPATPSTTKSSAKATPFPIASRATREEGAHAIFGYVRGISACPDNIATPALTAAFPDWDDRKITTWSNQLLCSISEYQLACVTRGTKYCAPLLPEEIEAKLPPLADYLVSDRCAVVDVHPKDNQSRALRVAVWLHSLDQNLVGGEDAAASLHLSDHRKGSLLNHFLSPGTSYLRTGMCLLARSRTIGRCIRNIRSITLIVSRRPSLRGLSSSDPCNTRKRS